MASKNAETRPKYAYRGPTLRRYMTRGDIERDIAERLAFDGNTLLSINWKKKTAHYLDAKGTKHSESINVRKPRMEKFITPPEELTETQKAVDNIHQQQLQNIQQTQHPLLRA